ncbi:MAG: hypothetical protein ABI678_02065 [Kofleriaceae bacterium]
MKAIFSMMLAVAGCGVSMQPDPSTGDDDAHPVGQLYGSVHDERGDTLDFSSGEPVHTHAGPSIDVATDCPAVWKYAYLESELPPMFGREATPNPLAWHLQAPAGTSEVAYRVRAADGRVLLDWTPVAPGDGGIYDIALHRNGAHAVPALSTTLNMYLDARIRDSVGAETVKTACWDNQPLAAPLAMGASAPGELFAMSLPLNSPISNAITSSVHVVQFPLEQQTADPVQIRIVAAQPSGAITKLVKSTFVDLGAVTPPAGSCDDSGDCSRPAMVPSAMMTDGVLAGTWSTKIEDALTGAVLCDDHGLAVNCVIPARLQGEAPHPYRVVIDLAGETSLSVGAGTGEFTSSTLSYTGLAPVTEGFYYCDNPHTQNGVAYCLHATQWAHVVVLDRASVSFSPIDLALTTTPDGGAGIVPPYLAPDTLTFGARVWDAGDEGL